VSAAPVTDLAATWLVAAADGDPDAMGRWAATIAGSADVAILEQVAPGRGRLASGRGLVIVRDRATELDLESDGWWSSRIDAAFRLRQTHAPSVPPDVTATPFMLLTRTYVPSDMRDEFRTWLQEEHSQRQLAVPGNRWYLGYEEIGERHSFMNFWGLELSTTAESDAWDQARAGMDRGVYRPLRATT
jgi:hypothetical protein